MGKAEAQPDLSVPESVRKEALSYLRGRRREIPVFQRVPSFYGGPTNLFIAMFDETSDAARVEDAREYGLPVTIVKKQ